MSVPFIFVNGTPGAGKTAVCKALVARGYLAHDVDEGFASWRWRDTGEVAVPSGDERRTEEWFNRVDWVVDRARVEAFRAVAGDRAAFFCGSMSNESEIWDLFDRVIHLAIDDETLRTRIATRDGNDFGRAPHELAALIEWNKTIASENQDYGAVVIDATRTLDIVVDDVVAIAERG